jgi:hypothetical protein
MVRCVAEDREDARRRRGAYDRSQETQQTCASVYVKEGQNVPRQPFLGVGVLNTESRATHSPKSKEGRQDGGGGSHSQRLKKGTISQLQRSAAVSRDGSGTEPMISWSGGLGVMRAYAGSEVAERVHANRADIGSVRRGSCSVQEKRTLGNDRQAEGQKRCAVRCGTGRPSCGCGEVNQSCVDVLEAGVLAYGYLTSKPCLCLRKP